MDECACARDEKGNLANSGYGDPHCVWHPPVDLDLQEADEAAEDVLACLCPPELKVGHFSDCPQAGTFRDLREPVTCPNEYGPPAGVHDGIFRFVFGECICAKLGATPCSYR